MRTLDQLEPRMPVAAVPFAITQPGSYVVVGNLGGGAADRGGLELEAEIQGLEDLDGLVDDFGANAVTGKNCDFHDSNTIKNIANCA